ncbi:MAG: DNA-3-methyladenine glycosylase [Myxococcales bacterium]|nr:DNA-3-methyladenine glycosylase [Myxococcales bacterium]
MLTDDARYDALITRDPRFDGVFFVGVSTTGIYCRPICPARTPGRTRCSFYATPVQAEAAGYRACFRCRPELAPGSTDTGSVDAIDTLVMRMTQRIAEGALNDGSVDDLAAELGVTARHLRRASEAKLGVAPIELALSRRLALAKQLIQDTALPITQVAFAAGFRSVRRFNAAFGQRMGSAPTKLRRSEVARTGDGQMLTLRLDYRAPYDWAQVVGFLRLRAIPGVELVTTATYRRIVHIEGVCGTIQVQPWAERSALRLDLAPTLIAVLMPLVARVRRLFDLDARPDAIHRVLSREPVLRALVARKPGLRVPGAIDPFEASMRALLGQQVSVAAATTFAGRFAAAFGTPVRRGGPGPATTLGADADSDALVLRFPTAAEIARRTPAEIAKIGLPAARAFALHSLATAITTGTIRLEGVIDLDRFVADMIELPGIGPWTAHYLAMRALHVPDAFPAADLGVKKALGGTPREAEARAEAWRPFRSYAVMHLWTSLGGPNVDDDDDAVPGRRVAPVRARRPARGRLPSGPASARGERARG